MTNSPAAEIATSQSFHIMRTAKKDIDLSYEKLVYAAPAEVPLRCQRFLEALETLAFAFNSGLLDPPTRQFLKGYLESECAELERRSDAIGDFWRANSDQHSDACKEIKSIIAALPEVAA
ncbi:hypothetical protein NOJ05_18310 [Neorhizobium galegae]|uniref:hypothetical protein n=1 Tax=Neorhizobium galegae TaxID=399 RepID=UPI00210829B9|nr:hypothetical protein [Neorhizobium galegae]MCQ1779161.1 hypothetical protein [Neorhizobium galegae]MCQ1799458.1 hypothetical protein [Neorhizobium galegae]